MIENVKRLNLELEGPRDMKKRKFTSYYIVSKSSNFVGLQETLKKDFFSSSELSALFG